MPAKYRPIAAVAPRRPKPPMHKDHSHRKPCPKANPDLKMTCWEYIEAMQAIDERVYGGP